MKVRVTGHRGARIKIKNMMEEADEYKIQEDPEETAEKACAAAGKWKVLLGGFMAGFLIGITVILTFIIVLLLGSLLQFGMMISGFMKYRNATGYQSIPNAAFSFLKIALTFSPFSFVIGLIGAICAMLRKINCIKRRKIILLSEWFEVSYEQVFLFAVFLLVFIAYGLNNLKGRTIVFDTFFAGENQYSFWAAGFAYVFLSVLLSGILQRMWWTYFRFILLRKNYNENTDKIETTDAHR